MAVISQGILGPISGKVGTVIGGSWKGIDYIRGLATSISNPNTLAQQEQRAKFSLMVAFLRPLLSFLHLGFRSSAIRMTAFNAAMSYNVKNAIKGLFPAFTIDFPKILVSKGLLPGVLNPNASSTVASQITFTWEDNTEEEGAQGSDTACFVVYSPDLKKAVCVVGAATRATGTQMIQLPDSFSGLEVQTYMSFALADESEVSDSSFVKALTIL